jgi:predicted secreted hydrolase
MNARLLSILAVLPILAASSALFAQGFGGLSRESGGFSQVTPGRVFAFPQDHGAHPGFRTEWWYVTANLTGADGASYGAQWTLFRQALEPGPEEDGWRSQVVWMAHAAATSAQDHLFAETFARGGIGQAGVVAQPFNAFIDDWTLAAEDERTFEMTAHGDDFRYALALTSDKPVVLQGEGGWSRKSPDGQASYYYSQPFFSVDGVLTLHGKDIKVTGRAWMDREWTSQYLAKDQSGWDWFALHLAGGEKLMLFRMRGAKGAPFCSGTWIDANGGAHPLGAESFELTPLEQTKIGERALPTRWRIKLPEHGLDIETSPLNSQSFNATSFPYWEGPIRFAGSQSGEGYLEMTGY